MAENRHLKQKPFIIPDNPLHTAKAWEDWVEGIEREFRYFGIQEDQDKADAMLIFGGAEIIRLSKCLPEIPQQPAQQDQQQQGQQQPAQQVQQQQAQQQPAQQQALGTYDRLKLKLDAHFKPRQNKHHARYQFLKTNPRTGESVVAYATRLREKARECDFAEREDDRILEHLIQTIHNKHLIKKAILKKLNITQFLAEAAQEEETSLQMNDMERPQEVARVESTDFKHRKPGYRQRPHFKQDKKYEYKTCDYCGKTGAHKPGEGCPAYGQRCRKCNKMHHFESVCRSEKTTDSRQHKRREIKKTTQESSEPSSSSSDDEFFGFARPIKMCKRTTEQKTVEIQINDVIVRAEPDSGADVNIMDKYQFKALQHRTQTDIRLEESAINLRTLTSNLPVKGQFTATVRNTTRGKQAQFIVIDERINSPPLLCKDTLEQLGMIEIREDGSLKEQNEEQIKTVKKKAITEIMNDHKEIFEGVGKIKGMRASFTMKTGAVPIAQKPRNIPYYLQTPLKTWLDKCIDQDLFERIPDNEPITWCSPLVVQPKPRFKHVDNEKLEDNMIRASIDLRIPNKFMERCKITPAAIVEDFTHKFHECTIFSKLDMNQGYNQLELDETSRRIATFSTPWGNIRPKRLIFGAKASQDLFDEAIYKIFGDIPHCLSQRDDILIGGRTEEEHNDTLQKVLERAKEYGVTFNKQKCKFGCKEIEFFGYKFTEHGIKPTEDKIKAITDCAAPESKEAVRSFLGMTGFLSKFIPKYADLTAPLRTLTRKEVRFVWGTEQQQAFEKLKKSITSDSVIAFFDPRLPITLRCEASFHEGLSAGLFQETDEGSKPVHFISRALTDTEKRYSQTEKDALAIAWAKERLRMYLLGAPRFKIITSHKPLIPLFSKPSAKLPPRIEKWVMNLQDMDYEIIYVPGKDEADPLDYLSRHPTSKAKGDNAEARVKMITETHAVVMEKIQNETMKDTQLQKIKERIASADWEQHRQDPDVQPFISVSQELYIADGVVFRLAQIVIPRSLQRKVIKAAHSQGHLGMTKLKQMMREKYWFPKMNSMIENIAKECFECQVTTKQSRREPVKIVKTPDEPWDTIAIDFGGPYGDGHYNLVAIDKRTRYAEVERVYSTSAKATTRKLLKIFSTHGIPRVVESDNGPPFNSTEFQQFTEENGIKHHRITPLHPQANGEAESFMRLLNKTEQIANITGEDSERAISKMLIGYNSTPHPATQTSPYRALMNRDVRTKIDHKNNIATEIKENRKSQEITELDQQYKRKMKGYADRNPLERNFVKGDHVLVKQMKRHKLSTAYEPQFYVVIEVNGSSIKARRITDDKIMHRDASHFKLANALLESRENNDMTERRELQVNEEIREPLKEPEITTPEQEEEKEDEDIHTPAEQEVQGEEQMAQPGREIETSEPGLRRSSRTRKPVNKLDL